MSIGEDTTIQLGLALAIIGVVVTVMIKTRRDNREDHRRYIEQMAKVDHRLGELADNQYTINQACEHALRMKIENPDMSIPDPRDPSKLLGSRSQSSPAE